MATFKQATSAVLELGVIAPIAVAQTTKEVAGGVVDTIRATRRVVAMADKSISVADAYLDRELGEAQLKLSIAEKAYERVLQDEETLASYAEAMASQILADLNPQEEEIDFKL